MPATRFPKARRVIIEGDPAGPVLRGAARELWRSAAPEAVISGPAETGKTFAALLKLDTLLGYTPGAQAVLVRKVRDTIHSTVLQTYMHKVQKFEDGKDVSDSGVRRYGGEKPQWFDYPSGARLWLAGIDDPGKALSSERDFIYVNQAEELSHDDWQVLTTRATGRAGNTPTPGVFGDCNPGPAHHWIKNRPGLTLLESRHEDNPVLWDADKGEWTEQGRRTLAVLDGLTGVRKERLRYGRWVSAEGTVFEFDAATHRVTSADLIARGLLTADGRRGPACRLAIAGVDWGYTAPGVLQVWLVDGDGRMALAREHYHTGKLIGWWVERAKEERERFGVGQFVCDPSEPAYIEQFRRAGLSAQPADNDRKPGIQAVQTRLAKAADGRPRLVVMANCLAERDESLAEGKQPVCTEQEFDSFVWKKYPDGRVNKEETTGPDHGMDSARYSAMWADRMSGGSGVIGLPDRQQRTLVPLPGRR